MRDIQVFQIEITETMINAGVEAYCDYEPGSGEPLRDRVCEIFLAMVAARESGGGK